VQLWIDQKLALYASDPTAVFVGQAPTGRVTSSTIAVTPALPLPAIGGAVATTPK
jgi:hypothetical protein